MQVEGNAVSEVKKPPAIVRFLGGEYNAFIFKLRYVFIAVFAIIGIVCGVIASNIEPLTKEESMIPQDSPIMVLNSLVEENFISETNFAS